MAATACAPPMRKNAVDAGFDRRRQHRRIDRRTAHHDLGNAGDACGNGGHEERRRQGIASARARSSRPARAAPRAAPRSRPGVGRTRNSRGRCAVATARIAAAAARSAARTARGAFAAPAAICLRDTSRAPLQPSSARTYWRSAPSPPWRAPGSRSGPPRARCARSRIAAGLSSDCTSARIGGGDDSDHARVRSQVLGSRGWGWGVPPSRYAVTLRAGGADHVRGM